MSILVKNDHKSTNMWSAHKMDNVQTIYVLHPYGGHISQAHLEERLWDFAARVSTLKLYKPALYQIRNGFIIIWKVHNTTFNTWQKKLLKSMITKINPVHPLEVSFTDPVINLTI